MCTFLLETDPFNYLTIRKLPLCYGPLIEISIETGSTESPKN